MNRRIYIAARYGRREEMEQNARLLEQYGFKITSRWVYGGEEGKDQKQIALEDVQDLFDCDVVLSFTEEKDSHNKGGGRHVEFGLGRNGGKTMALIGPREVVFHHLPRVLQYDTLKDFIEDWSK